MSHDHARPNSPSAIAKTASETSPLLQRKDDVSSKEPPRKWPRSVVYRVLVAAFLMSLSFGVTQVPLIYVFGVFKCEEYYKHHALPPLGTPEYDSRCQVHSIQASTARAVALLGTGTTLFGVANLFITGWTIKAWGVKKALLITIFWPAVRLLVQNFGVEIGADQGILIIQLSQILTVVGGPAGYLLALNSFATEVVMPVERTAIIGRLTGCAMFGTALGYLAGGLMSDAFGIASPFRVTLVLFCIATVYGMLCLPTIPHNTESEKNASKSLGAFFEPLRMFLPRKWVLPRGTVRREYGVLLLGTGAFLAVFATGYQPVLLQMYATDVFGFGTTDNSELISLNFVVRAIYLTFAFPAIIDHGRSWLDRRTARQQSAQHNDSTTDDSAIDDALLPTDPRALASAALPSGEARASEPDEPFLRRPSTPSTKSRRPTTSSHDPQHPNHPEYASEHAPEHEDHQSYAFDLLYTRYSLLADALLTTLCTLVTSGWQMYLIAIILPLAAGTGSATKGTMLQMCAPEQRTDALSAISLLEMVARLSTTSVFGLVFSVCAGAGRAEWTFAANGAVAVVGAGVLLFARFPPEGARRWGKG